MKIRNGFVSNSSSSSFVIIGVYNEYMEYIDVSMDKLQEYAKTVAEKMEVDINEVKLVAGTRPC